MKFSNRKCFLCFAGGSLYDFVQLDLDTVERLDKSVDDVEND